MIRSSNIFRPALITCMLFRFASFALMPIVCWACSSSSVSHPIQTPTPTPRLIPGYSVGVDYHAYGASFGQTTFLSIYQHSEVRQTVRAQLQGMADQGATFMQLAIFFAHDPNFPGLNWETTFPMSDQDETNLRSYAQDVAAVQGSQGNRLRLDISFVFDDAADLTVGSPTTGLGNAGYSAADYTSRVQLSTDKVLAAVGDVIRPDGVHLVDTIYLVSGDPVGAWPDASPNSEWFITTHYPRFVSVVSARGFQPAVYFSVCCKQADVLDDGYIDAQYPILNGHRSVATLYRWLKFMIDHGLYIPPRIDFGYYVAPAGATYPQLLTRVLNDADATLPSLGAARPYGVAETFYPVDSATRRQFGQAFADEAAARPRLKHVSFWTTPHSGLNGESAAYPFAIGDYLYP